MSEKTALMSRAHWRLLARIFIFLFVLIFVSSFAALTFFEIYYAGHRPRVPEPSHTVRLPWTFPVSYGTTRDAALMTRIFFTGFSSWMLFGVGWAIRIYILNEDMPIRGTAPGPGRLTREPAPDD